MKSTPPRCVVHPVTPSPATPTVRYRHAGSRSHLHRDPGSSDDEEVPLTDDDRPPICPACGVTMGIVVDEETGETVDVCLECGFGEDDAGSLKPRAHSHPAPPE